MVIVSFVYIFTHFELQHFGIHLYFSDPDPLEHATGREKKMLIARLAGDDRYEPKV